MRFLLLCSPKNIPNLFLLFTSLLPLAVLELVSSLLLWFFQVLFAFLLVFQTLPVFFVLVQAFNSDILKYSKEYL
jgi:hypothetical protein